MKLEYKVTNQKKVLMCFFSPRYTIITCPIIRQISFISPKEAIIAKKRLSFLRYSYHEIQTLTFVWYSIEEE